MNASSSNRWAISFADLALLLLGFFVLLQVANGREASVLASTRAAFDGAPAGASALMDRPAAMLFEPGEARLKHDARRELARLGVAAARRGRRLQVESRGWPDGAARFDRWELAAARAAAVARALADGGLGVEKVDIVLPPVSRAPADAQQIIVHRI